MVSWPRDRGGPGRVSVRAVSVLVLNCRKSDPAAKTSRASPPRVTVRSQTGGAVGRKHGQRKETGKDAGHLASQPGLGCDRTVRAACLRVSDLGPAPGLYPGSWRRDVCRGAWHPRGVAGCALRGHGATAQGPALCRPRQGLSGASHRALSHGGCCQGPGPSRSGCAVRAYRGGPPACLTLGLAPQAGAHAAVHALQAPLRARVRRLLRLLRPDGLRRDQR